MVQRLSFVVLGLASILWCAFSSSCFAADGAAPEAGTATSQIVPFKLYRGHMIVARCSVGGLHDLIAVIDTGASETVLDMTLVRKLALPIQTDSATFITQQAKIWAVAIPELQLGPIRVERLPGIATDLSSLTAELGIRPQVLIGMDLLHRSSFLIDYRSRQLVFFQVSQPQVPRSQVPQGPAPPLGFGPLLKLPHSAALIPGDSTSAGRFAVIEASIRGKILRLQVDSGFDGLLLYRARVPGFNDDRMFSAVTPVAAAFRGGEAHVANVSQTLLARSYASPGVEIGDWRAPHAQLLVVDGPPPESAQFDGLIGTAVLSQRRVAFDFQNGMIYWE
jgi:predicted aspartyl protease